MSAKTAAHNSSPNTIVLSAERIRKSSFPKGKWLFRNSYQDDILEKITAEMSALPNNPEHISRYIAASTVLHCSDGWNLFSCAMDDLLNGDNSNAVFMAYYAQIRALMSFFATEGICILDYKHYYFDSTGIIQSFTGKTHPAIRELTTAWANDTSKGSRLLDLLTYDGKKFSEWVAGADIQLGTPLIQEISKDWLNAWSIDLGLVGNDHNLRNKVSYRPQGIKVSSHNHGIRTNLDFCLEAWKVSEPLAPNHFEQLDRYLLRETLVTIYKNRKPSRSDFRQFVRTSMTNLGVFPNERLFKFLISSHKKNENLLLSTALKPAESKNLGIDAVPMICRAFLLLRIASAAVENFLKVSAISNLDLQFWWSKYGIKNGLWTPTNPPEQMDDLWVDIDSSCASLQSFLASSLGDIHISDIRKAHAFDLWQVKQFTRAGLWGLGL